MTGIEDVVCDDFKRRHTSQPSNLGSMRSRRIKSGISPVARIRPSSPSDAAMTSYPLRLSASVKNCRIGSSSSTTRILIPLIKKSCPFRNFIGLLAALRCADAFLPLCADGAHFSAALLKSLASPRIRHITVTLANPFVHIKGLPLSAYHRQLGCLHSIAR